MYLSPWGHSGVEFDFAKCGFVASNVLLKQAEQRFGLLRAEINPLEIANLYLCFGLLLHGAEGEEKIPDVDAHLHAVGIVFAIIGRIAQLDLRLWRKAHMSAV
jgi:hypothetical protein